MKIRCESCSAKYTVADEKVAGRAFKIRCRCGAAIVVRGEAIEHAPSAPPEGEWYVIVSGTDEGPLDAAQIAAMFAEGAIDGDSYVWKEGLAEWCALSDVEELVRAIRASSPSARARVAPGADLFASSAAEPSFGSERSDEVGSHATEASLTGSRNDNSVLFSLSNLQALSTAPASASVAPGKRASEPARATPSGDPSGLIEIHGLAAASGAISKSSTSSGARVDHLLSLGPTSFGSMSSPLGAPMIMPERKSTGTSALLVALSATGAFVAAAAALVMAVVVVQGRTHARAENRSADPVIAATHVVEAAVSSMPEAERTAIVEPTAALELARVEPSFPESTAPDPTAPGPTAPDLTAIAAEAPREPAERSEGSLRRERERERERQREGEREEVLPPASRSEIAPRERGEQSVESLIDEAVRGAPAPSEPVVADTAPPTPSRGDIVGAMDGVSGPVRACGNGAAGLVPVRIVFAGASGRVQSAEVQGASVAPEVRSCVARAVRGALVPRFQQNSFSVTYPFRL